MERCRWRCEIRLDGCQGAASEVDRIGPVSQGGTHDLGNLRGACRSCHARTTAEAVNGIFADAAKRDGANQDLHMRLMDGVTQARALRARTEARYGNVEGLYDRLAARSALSARVWC
jgi:hypothetical protein